MKPVVAAMKQNVVGRRKRIYGLRCIGQTLMRIYQDEDNYMALVEREEAHGNERRRRKANAQRRVRRRLWYIFRIQRTRLEALGKPRKWYVGPVERWVDEVHREGELVARMVHAMTCLMVYIRHVHRPVQRRRECERREVARRRHGLWLICSTLVRIYKQDKQIETLRARAQAREGLVCAHTRNVGRLAPQGGVKYDETRRYRERIAESALYKTHRWPRRDKCGPTLVGLLYHMWGIT